MAQTRSNEASIQVPSVPKPLVQHNGMPPVLSIWLDSRLRQVPQQISQANEVLMLQMPVVIVIAVCIILHVGLHVFTVDICDKANVSSKNVQTQ